MSKKTTDLPIKTTPVAADILTWLDSEDSNLPTKDKWFTLSTLWTAVFWSNTTADIPEWSNLYYTEARVSANTTVTWLWTTKADKTNVLELDNTTAFTPDADYEPTPKKYVDDEIAANLNIIATDAQSKDATQEMVSINPKQLLSNWIIVSDTLIVSADTEAEIDVTAWPWVFVKVKEIEMWNYVLWWTIRVKFDLKWLDVGGDGAYWRIYIDWVSTWIRQETLSTTYVTFSEDFTLDWPINWTKVQLYISFDSWVSTTKVYAENFRIYYDEVALDKTPVVILD